MDNSELYHAPTLLFLICAMSAMGFVMATYRWLWRVMKSKETIQSSFVSSVWYGQIQAFIFVLFLSIFVGVFDFFFAGRTLHIGGEVFLISSLLIFSAVRGGKGNRLVLFRRLFKGGFVFGFLCLLGWGLTILIGLSISYFLKMSASVNRSDFDVLIAFIPGILWNVPILIMYFKILKSAEMRHNLKGYSVHKFLWPVLFAYIALLVPLMMQEIANSKEWNEMKNAKIIKRA